MKDKLIHTAPKIFLMHLCAAYLDVGNTWCLYSTEYIALVANAAKPDKEKLSFVSFKIKIYFFYFYISDIGKPLFTLLYK